jgi:thiamine pyrophosphate-dependent acetolactate synthase large subunit-like protein
VAVALRERGVSVIFGLVGHTNYLFVASFIELGGRFVTMRHESGVVAAADAYARSSGGVGVATVTQGPGLTNTATALVEARKASTPVLLVAGDTVLGTEDNQDIDQDAFAESLGIQATRPISAEDALATSIAAFDLALTGRRPVLLSLRQDIQAACIADSENAPTVLTPLSGPRANELEAAIQVLLKSKRPVIVAGRGCVVSGAKSAVMELAEQLGAPLATTIQAHGLFSGHPLNIGICGGFSVDSTWEILSAADTIIAIGASLTTRTTRNGALFAGTDVIHIDSAAQGDFGVSGDADISTRALLEHLRAHRGRRSPWAERSQLAFPEDASDETGMDPSAATMELDSVLPQDRIVVLDSGHHLGWPARYLSVPNERSWVFAQDFQSLGLGLAGAVGAGQAHPDSLTVSIVGDGGLRMSLSELDSAICAGTPLLVVVYDDSAYGAELHQFGPVGEPVEPSLLRRLDFAGVATAMGARSATVRQADEIGAALADWLAAPSGVFLLQMYITRSVRGDWMDNDVQHQFLQDNWMRLKAARSV